MDNAINEAQGGTHFWLRYAQQFTVGARTHTIEMSFPVPIGATPEECTRLLQEADARFKQVETHVERRVTQMQHRSAPQAGAPASTPTSRPPNQPASRPPVQPAAAPSSPSAHVLSRDPREAADVAASPATSPAPPRTPQEAASRQDAPPRPPARLNLPSTPGPMRNEGSNLKVAEFLNIVRDNYKLDPREVMGLLNVKSLSTINLNDALEDLRHIIEQNNHAAPPANQAAPGNRTAPRPDEKPASASRPENITSAQTAPVPAVQAPSAPARQVANGNNRAATPAREAQAGYGFDEEEGLEEDDDLDFEEEDDDPQEQAREMTAQEEARGRQLISDLRGVRGNKPASDSRLNVLMNIVGSQIDEDDLQRLVRGVWGVNYLKQLKVDQVERLISWGKEDDFENDVQLVLPLL
ncbi:MAG: hypothetical protein H0W02_18375 [Ktedonobacteraceae bacterium]|nr:hypothetical protein [Ktedonobacteraceae bacterium]